MPDNAGRLLPEEEIIAKYTIKDSVFSDLFKIKNISFSYTGRSTLRISRPPKMT